MRAMFCFAVAVACVLGACQLPSSGTNTNPNTSTGEASGARPELSCAPKQPGWSQVQTLFDTTDASVHELITCGGLQVRLAGQIVLMLIASNEDLFKKDGRELLDEVTINPFTRTDDGHWTTAIEGAPDSAFTLAFYDPDSGERISENVFDLDTYLKGVHIQSTSLAEMAKDLNAKHPFVFTWDSPGPLAHLLNDGKALPDGFTLQLSLADFLSTQPADFGPFESVFSVEVDSVVDYVDHRGDGDAAVDIDYRVTTMRDQLAHISLVQGLRFDVDHLEGSAGTLTLDGKTDDLTFVQNHELAGRIDYTLSGKLSGDAVDMRVRDDFGQGAAYPETMWSCE